MKIIIHTDGASKGNPGKAGAGVSINAEKVIFHKKYLGIKTNNQAEYLAIMEAYEILDQNKLNGELDFFMDSELAVKQLNGIYKVKNPEIKKIYDKIKEKEKKFEKINYTWVPREKNQVADALANEALNIE